jgi:hypothetical protein
MRTLLAVIALTAAVACGKKVEAVQAPVVAEPAKVEAQQTVTVAGVQTPVVVETVVAPDAGVQVIPVVPAPPASPVK